MQGTIEVAAAAKGGWEGAIAAMDRLVFARQFASWTTGFWMPTNA